MVRVRVICFISRVRDLSRSIIQSSGENMLSQLWLFVGLYSDGLGCLFCLCRLGELHLSRWRFTGVGVTAESAAG